MSDLHASSSNVRASGATPLTAITYLPIDLVSSDPKNPRIHRRDQVRAIARSIEAFGFNAPILVDNNNRVVAGHGRLEAATYGA